MELLRSISTCAALAWAAAHSLQGGAAEQAQAPPIRTLRYDEDYSFLRGPAVPRGDGLAFEALKYIPLNQAGDRYLSIGGEVRQEYEHYHNRGLGTASSDDDGGYLLERYVLHADLHVGERTRFFGQLYSAPTAAEDIEPAPVDEDNLRLQQAFADCVVHSGADHALTLRAGRQELLYGSERLVGVREGLNVRRSFDALRMIGNCRGWRVDGFLSRPVEVDPQAFHDTGDQDQTFWGVYATRPADQGAGLDLYYLGLRHDDAGFTQGVADELRHTVGSRYFGKSGPWDYNCESMLQLGEFGAGGIFAWSAASDNGYALEAAPFQPRLGLKASIISGDEDPDDADLGTFNALFPRGNYFGESSIMGPANLFTVHPSVQGRLADGIHVEAGWDFFWRYSVEDGVYGPAGNVLQSPNGSTERYVGSELSLLLGWQFNRELSLRMGCSHFFAGSFLEDAGPGEDVDYLSVTLAYRF